LEGKLDYKNAFFALLPVALQRISPEESEWLWETILPNLDDQKSVIDFSLQIVKDSSNRQYQQALKFLIEKTGVQVGKDDYLEGYLKEWGLEVLEKKVLASIKPAEKPEEPERHEAGSEG
jgi:hypothetical protein